EVARATHRQQAILLVAQHPRCDLLLREAWILLADLRSVRRACINLRVECRDLTVERPVAVGAVFLKLSYALLSIARGTRGERPHFGRTRYIAPRCIKGRRRVLAVADAPVFGVILAARLFIDIDRLIDLGSIFCTTSDESYRIPEVEQLVPDPRVDGLIR